MAMILYPEVQRKAQQELDLVLGKDRLPDFSDRESLPYVEALFMECFRWYPQAPLGTRWENNSSDKCHWISTFYTLGVPHATTEADEYNGFYIPKGSVVIGNTWYDFPHLFKLSIYIKRQGFASWWENLPRPF